MLAWIMNLGFAGGGDVTVGTRRQRQIKSLVHSKRKGRCK